LRKETWSLQHGEELDDRLVVVKRIILRPRVVARNLDHGNILSRSRLVALSVDTLDLRWHSSARAGLDWLHLERLLLFLARRVPA
jgi:hypothetical protein